MQPGAIFAQPGAASARFGAALAQLNGIFTELGAILAPLGANAAALGHLGLTWALLHSHSSRLYLISKNGEGLLLQTYVFFQDLVFIILIFWVSSHVLEIHL